MKKIVKLSLFIIASLFSLLVIDAASCDNFKINTDTWYHESGWDAYAYVCREQFDGPAITECSLTTHDAALKWCEGTYQYGGYKGAYHTVSTPKCSESSVCSCYKCKVSCYMPTGGHHECDGTSSPHYSHSSYSGERGELVYYCDTYSWQEKTKTYESTTGECLESGKIREYESEIKKECGSYWNNGATCDNDYQIKYNKYSCNRNNPLAYKVRNVREGKYYALDAAGNRVDVYCINPGDDPAASTTVPVVNRYIEHAGTNVYTVDATACENSYSTEECGFANILIESYYRRLKGNQQYDYAVTGAALRLWSAYMGNSGFKDTGIGDEDDSTISSNKWLKFVPYSGNNYINVFQATMRNLMKNQVFPDSSKSYTSGNNAYLGSRSRYDVDTKFGASFSGNFDNVTCSSGRMGMFCSDGNTNRYLYAITLFVNTVQGNPYMLDHLKEIHDIKNGTVDDEEEVIDNSPESGSVSGEGNVISVTYRLKKGVQINCSMLDEDEQNDAGCEVEQKLVYFDGRGHEVTIDHYDYCQKNYCYVDVVLEDPIVECDEIEKVTVKTKTIKRCGQESVKYYVSCGSTDEQIMYSFEPDKNCGGEPTHWEEIDLFYECDPCDETPVYPTPDNFSCSLNSDNYYSAHVATDPSLNCILHKSSFTQIDDAKGKAYYDYSEIFNVNTDICRVYCSDTINYYMAPREYAGRSLQFKYDIESGLLNDGIGTHDSTHSVTNTILINRTCVSEVFYDIPFEHDKNWEKAYGIIDSDEWDSINDILEDEFGYDDEVDSISNWQELYAMLKTKSDKESGRLENLNKIIYDLYNCNFFRPNDNNGTESSKEIPRAVGKPKDLTNIYDVRVNGKDYVPNAYEVANKILSNTQNYCNNNSCVTGKIKYIGGAQYIESSNQYNYTGLSWNDPILKSDSGVTDDISIQYCDDGCFRGDHDNNGKFEEDIDAAVDNPYVKRISYDGNNIDIPTNRYVIFSYGIETDLYNSTRYQVEQFSGNVKSVNDNSSFDSNLLTMDSYLYPVDDVLQDKCELIRMTDGKEYYKCNVYHSVKIPAYNNYNRQSNRLNYNIINGFYRKSTADEFISEVNKNEADLKYTCQYFADAGGKIPGEDVFIFRNIDLKDPVPNARNNTNWDITHDNEEYASYVRTVISEIKESGNNNLYATDEYLEYSYILTPDSIRRIREDNEDMNYDYHSMNLLVCSGDSGKYSGCVSEFMDDLSDDFNEYNVTVIKSDGISNHTKDKNGGSE